MSNTQDSGGAMPPVPPPQRVSKLVAFGLLIASLALIGTTWMTIKSVHQDPALLQKELQSSKAEDNVFKVVAETVFGIGGGTSYLLRSEVYGIVVVTNRHICNLNPVGGIFVLDQDQRRYLTKIKRIATKTDLCILEPPEEFLTKYKGLTLAPAGTQLESGEMLYVFGHPALRKLTGSSGPFINESWVPLEPHEDFNAERLSIGRADVAIYPGSSGSPVLNGKGEVVGTIFAYETQTNIGLFIPLSAMIEFLNGGM